MSSYNNSPVEIELNLEIIGTELILVSKNAQYFDMKHIQNPPKSALGKKRYYNVLSKIIVILNYMPS